MKKHNLAFPVLADIDNEIADHFGLTFSLPEDLKRVYSGFGIDLVRFNGNEQWQLPLSGHFIADASGVIRNVDVHPDYTKRPDPPELVELLRSLN